MCHYLIRFASECESKRRFRLARKNVHRRALKSVKQTVSSEKGIKRKQRIKKWWVQKLMLIKSRDCQRVVFKCRPPIKLSLKYSLRISSTSIVIKLLQVHCDYKTNAAMKIAAYKWLQYFILFIIFSSLFYFFAYFILCEYKNIFNRCRIFSLLPRGLMKKWLFSAYYGIRSCNTSASLNMLFVYNFFSFTSLCLLCFFFSPRSLLVI